MSYLNIHLQIPKAVFIPILIAELSEMGFDSFQEFENKIEAYILEEAYSESALNELLQRYQEQFVCKVEKIERLEDQNWNALWESNFDPVKVTDQMVVKAPFHTIEEPFRYTITMQPKMAFGTGHHETTWLMLFTMLEMDFDKQSVFDYGSGTAILSIAAELLGANHILAVDIDDWAFENAKENIELNNCRQIEVRQGGIKCADGKEFDTILANINKNVILQSLEALNVCLRTGGHILFSGLLQKDKEEVLAAFKGKPWKVLTVSSKGDWIMIKVCKV